MRYFFRLACVAGALLLAAGAARAQSASELCERYDKLADAFKIAEAKSAIEAANRQHPGHYEILWRLARALVAWGDEQPEDDQEAIYKRAVDIADQAVRKNPSGMQGYMRRAAANGKVALFKGVFSVSDVVTKVRDDAQKAIDLNNLGKHELGLAHYILGRVHLKLAEKPWLVRAPLGLGFGDIDEALANLRKATELRWGFAMFHLAYARALAEEDHYNDARKHLNIVAKARTQDKDDDQVKKEARELMQEIADE